MDFKIFILVSALGCSAGLVRGQAVTPVGLPHPEQVSVVADSTRKIIGALSDLSVGDRVKLVQSLGTNLLAADAGELIRYLAAPLVAEENPSEIHWLKNEVMNQLRKQNPPLSSLPQALAALYLDAKQDPVIRDYALQHLAECRWNQAAREQAKQILWQAAMETNGTLAGTALLGMARIYEAEGSSPERLRSAALAAAQNPKLSEASRLTALSLCGRMGESRALPVALAAVRPEQSMVLRIVAVDVIGKLGGQPELVLLTRLEASGEPRLLPALRQARKALETRLARV